MMTPSATVFGDYVSVPDLHGRLVILDKNNTIMAVLGHNPDPAKRMNFNVPQDQWIEGIFSGTHGSYWDKDGNLYMSVGDNTNPFDSDGYSPSDERAGKYPWDAQRSAATK